MADRCPTWCDDHSFEFETFDGSADAYAEHACVLGHAQTAPYLPEGNTITLSLRQLDFQTDNEDSGRPTVAAMWGQHEAGLWSDPADMRAYALALLDAADHLEAATEAR